MSNFFHSKKPVVLITILWGLFLAAVLLFWLHGNEVYWRLPVPVQAAQPSGHGPYSYIVPMGTDWLSQTDTFDSPALLLEDERTLGPANALHARIGKLGAGRFSFWKGNLYFSSSDNSDPRINGRKYILALPYQMPVLYLGFLIFVLLVGSTLYIFRQPAYSLLAKYRGQLRSYVNIAIGIFNKPVTFYVLVALLAVWINYGYFSRIPILPCLQPDSWGYLSINSMRTQGNFIFYSAILRATGDFRWMVPIQLNLLLFSSFLLSASLRRLFSGNVYGMVVAFFLMLNTQQLSVYPDVLSEALFISLLGMHIAAILFLLDRFSIFWLIISGLSLAYLVIVRQNAISFLVGIPFLILIYSNRSHLKAIFLAIVLPVILVICMQVSFNYYYQGFPGMTTLTGLTLAGKYAWLITDKMPTKYPDLVAALANDLKPLYKTYPEASQRSFPNDYIAIQGATTTPAQYQHIAPVAGAYIDSSMPNMSPIEKAIYADKILQTIAVEAILYNPKGFAIDVLSTYYSYWVNHTLMLSAGSNLVTLWCYQSSTDLIPIWEPFSHFIKPDWYQSKEIKEKINSQSNQGPMPVEALRYAIQPYRNIIVLVVFIVSLIGLIGIAWARRFSKEYQAIIFLALTLHVNYLLLSFGNLAILRYANAFDSIVILIFLSFVFIAGRYIISLRKVN